MKKGLDSRSLTEAVCAGTFCIIGKNFEKVRKNFIRCRRPAPLACRIRAEIGGRRGNVTAADRRRTILEALSSDKFTTRANLAFEFGVSKI